MDSLRPTSVKWPEEASHEPPAAGARGPTAEARAAERRLIEQAQGGDQGAFAQLVRLHQRRVFSLIAHLVRQPNEVEDLAQQVFFKVYRSLERFNFQAAFSTWLHRIVVNECYDHLRRQRAQKAGPGQAVALDDLVALERLPGIGGSAEPDAARRVELRQAVEQLFRRLPETDRVLLALRELEGLSMEEIGRVLGIKENTVKVRLFRARRRLLEIHRRLRRAEAADRRGMKR